MAKRFSRSMCALSAFFSLFMVCGCNSQSNETVNSGASSTKGISNNELYTDSKPIETDKLIIEALSPSCTKNDNYFLSVSLKITNKESKTCEVVFNNVKLIKESTGAEYTVNSFYKKLSIEAELNQTATFTSTIPTSISEDNYKLSLDINDLKVTYFLYEIPDSLRADRKINYYVSDKLVKTEIVKDGRKAGKLLIYETPDNVSHCNTWYTTKNGKESFSASQVVTSDVDLYGTATSNFDSTTTSSDAYSFISGVNYVPSNGSLVLPRKLKDKELCISNYAIRNIDVQKIYIPKTVHTIYSGNFTGIGEATIYYEGTESEWRSLFYMSSDVITTRVVFNSSYK